MILSETLSWIILIVLFLVRVAMMLLALGWLADVRRYTVLYRHLSGLKIPAWLHDYDYWQPENLATHYNDIDKWQAKTNAQRYLRNMLICMAIYLVLSFGLSRTIGLSFANLGFWVTTIVLIGGFLHFGVDHGRPSGHPLVMGVLAFVLSVCGLYINLSSPLSLARDDGKDVRWTTESVKELSSTGLMPLNAATEMSLEITSDGGVEAWLVNSESGDRVKLESDEKHQLIITLARRDPEYSKHAYLYYRDVEIDYYDTSCRLPIILHYKTERQTVYEYWYDDGELHYAAPHSGSIVIGAD